MNSIDYNESFLKDLARSRRHFWYLHRNKIIYWALRKFSLGNRAKILELGAGSGNVLAYLVSKGVEADGADIYDSSLSYISRYAGKAFKYDVRRDPSAAEETRGLKGSYDAVIMADVLEHLDDPAAALRNAGYFCRKGGVVVITVPAMQELWSPYDVACGHKKRYDVTSLRRMIRDAGMDCLSIKHIFFTTAIALFIKRKIGKSAPGTDEELISREFDINVFINGLFKLICSCEFLTGKISDFPIGSSIIGVAKNTSQ